MRDYPCDPEVFGRISAAVVDGPNPEMKERLARAIENLDPELAELVNAVVWERVPKREMARRLGVSRPHIDKQLGIAFELIRVEMDWTRDAYYETKKARQLLVPVDEYLTDDEAAATLYGRSRGDGRRLDSFTLDDPVASWGDPTRPQ